MPTMIPGFTSGVLQTGDSIRIRFNRTVDTGSCSTTGSIGTATATWSVFNPGTLCYVRQGAMALNELQTASTPFPDLQTAIDDLAGCAVLIHEGTYTTSLAE